MTFCVFGGLSVPSVVSPRRAQTPRGACGRDVFVGANGRSPLQHVKSGRGTPRPYPTTFCVFGGLSVSSGVSPRRAQTPRGACGRDVFVGANGRSPLQHVKSGRGTPRPYPMTFCVFGGVSVSSVFPRAAPKRRGGFVWAQRCCALLECGDESPLSKAVPRHRTPKTGRGTPRPSPMTFCVFCGVSVSSVVSRLTPKTRGFL